MIFFFSSAASVADENAGRIRVFESSLRPAISVQGTPAEHWTLRERMAHWKVPGVSIAVIRGGKLAWARGYGVLQAGGRDEVNSETVFSVGSLSKVGAAAVTLRLVDAGKIDLDRNVNDYLTRWHLPDNEFTAIRPVTLRGVLSHSAGISVHGFADFQPGAALPTLIDTLEGRAPARNAPVRVVAAPGSRFDYSGGGVQLEQLVVEEVAGLDFPAAASRFVFEPLGMSRSTYVTPLPATYANIAKAHGRDGQPRALPRGYESMPEAAASGLWTTPSDYARLVIAMLQSSRGQGDFLSGELARQMLTEVGRSPAGLGPFLDGEGLNRRFWHGGANDSYRAWMEGHPGTGNGVVIFTNGTNGNDLYPEIRRAIAVAEGWSTELSGHASAPALNLLKTELEEKAGVYEVQPPVAVIGFRTRSEAIVYRVRYRDGQLFLNADAGRNETPLVPLDASRFIMDAGRELVTLEFVRGYRGEISQLLIRGGANYTIEAGKVAR